MNKQDRRIFMERVIVLCNGLAGAVVGFCVFVCLGILSIQFDFAPESVFQFYLCFIGIPILFCSIGFYLAVRKDWWVMKRRW